MSLLNKIKICLCDLDYIILNYFVTNVPIWHIRRLFYLLHGMTLGKNSRINMKCIIYAPWKISVGHNTIVNEYCLLDGRGHLSIGDNVSVSMFSVIYTASHYSWSRSFEYYTKKTVINSGAWIGTRGIVMPGSVIAKGTIISANSVYCGGVSEANKIYRGNPAVIIRNRQLENEEINLENIMFFK